VAKFAPGHRKIPGSGRRKGQASKAPSSRAMNELVATAFDKIGGVEALVRWIEEDPRNRETFYTKIAARLAVPAPITGNTFNTQINGPFDNREIARRAAYLIEMFKSGQSLADTPTMIDYEAAGMDVMETPPIIEAEVAPDGPQGEKIRPGLAPTITVDERLSPEQRDYYPVPRVIRRRP
jgi:hypothetical protein